jgi:transposase
MEDVLDQYATPDDPRCPLVCMDEAAPQVLADAVEPLPAAPGQPRREDYHYQRLGTRSLFLFVAPQLGWRRVSVREHRTAQDWAEEMAELLLEDFPQAETIRLVCDNLNTHHVRSLYGAFDAAKAGQLKRRVRIHFTPRNGSWLNAAEIELSALQRQCLDKRFGSVEQFEAEVQAWVSERNEAGCKIQWRFRTEDARQKLSHLYPHPAPAESVSN